MIAPLRIRAGTELASLQAGYAHQTAIDSLKSRRIDACGIGQKCRSVCGPRYVVSCDERLGSVSGSAGQARHVSAGDLNVPTSPLHDGSYALPNVERK